MTRRFRNAGIPCVLIGGGLAIVLAATQAQAQAQVPATSPAVPPHPAQSTADAVQVKAVEAVEAAFQTQLQAAQIARLQALVALAGRHEASSAGWITETVFEHAIADDLFQQAEAEAGRVIALGTNATADAWLLARIVDVVAKVDRGAYDESVAGITRALTATGQGGRANATAVISLLEVYYHQLLSRQQFAVATRAFEAARAATTDPAVQTYLDQRLARLGMIGKPAPALVGKTLDGKAFDLASWKGKVVVVVFWASWCVSNAEEIDSLVAIAKQYQPDGLEIVGVNLDTAQVDNSELATLLPNIKRFLLDYNVAWPTLVNGHAADDHAAAYNVTDLPASVVIDRQGNIVAIDMGVKPLYLALPSLLGKN